MTLEALHSPQAHPLRGQQALLFDWGNTLMREFAGQTGPMVLWPQVAALPYTRQTLARLRQSWTIAVATNAAASDEVHIWAALQRVGLAKYIDKVYCFRSLGYKKPSAEFFTAILRNLGLRPADAIMIGDDFAVDVLGATSIGIRGIWLNEQSDEVRAAPLYQTIRSFLELPSAIEEISRPIGDRS